MNLGEYISQLDAPPASSGIPRANLESAESTAVRVANDLAQAFRSEADDIQRANDMAAIDVSARKQMKDMEASLEASPDWQTHEQRWADGFSKIKASLMDGINDPHVKRAAVVHLGNLEGDGVMRAAGRSRQMAVDTFDAFRLTSKKNALDAISTSTDPADEDSAIGIHLGTIAAQEQGGWLAPDKATKERQDFLQDVTVYRAKKDILSNPATYFQKKKEGAYAGVDLHKSELLDMQAIRQVEHNDRVAERQAKKNQDRNDAIFIAGVENSSVDDVAADDLFLGPTRDPDFTPLISPGAYKEGKLKLAVRRREGGARNSGITSMFKVQLGLNPHRYSDKEIVSLGDKGLNPADVLDVLEYKRGRIKDLQEMPPGSITGLSMIREAVPRGINNEMNDTNRRKMIRAEEEYIWKVRKNPEKWFDVAVEMAARFAASSSGGQADPQIQLEMIKLNSENAGQPPMTQEEEARLLERLRSGAGPPPMSAGPPKPDWKRSSVLRGIHSGGSFVGNLFRSIEGPADITP